MIRDTRGPECKAGRYKASLRWALLRCRGTLDLAVYSLSIRTIIMPIIRETVFKGLTMPPEIGALHT